MHVFLSFYNDRSIRECVVKIINTTFRYQIIVIISRLCSNRVLCIAVHAMPIAWWEHGCLQQAIRAWHDYTHIYVTVFGSSGDVTCQPFPPVRGFGILVCCKIGWRQVGFSWEYPFTGRYSKESEHFKIIIWDRR